MFKLKLGTLRTLFVTVFLVTVFFLNRSLRSNSEGTGTYFLIERAWCKGSEIHQMVGEQVNVQPIYNNAKS